MEEMYKIAQQAKYKSFGIDKVYKLGMDGTYELGLFIEKFEFENFRICVVSVVRK